MRHSFFYLAFYILPFCLFAQKVPESDQSLIDNYIISHTFSSTEIVLSDTVQMVFTGNFYKVSPGNTYADGQSLGNPYFFNIREGRILEMEELSESKNLELLPTLVRNDFLLLDESNAKIFEAALDKLYPLDNNDKKEEKHEKKNNQWIFIRGKFFSNYSALIVTADPSGNISGIDFSLDYPGI